MKKYLTMYVQPDDRFMETLTTRLNDAGELGWKLHSLVPAPGFRGGGGVWIAVFEADVNVNAGAPSPYLEEANR